MTDHTHQEAKEAEIVNDGKDDKYSYCRNNWSINRIFWGLLLVVIGGLMLVDNFNIVQVDWSNLWKLWPLIIISCGLSILAIRSWFWRILSILLVIATMGVIVWAAVGGQDMPGSTNLYDSIQRELR